MSEKQLCNTLSKGFERVKPYPISNKREFKQVKEEIIVDYIAQAIDKHTGLFGTCTHTDYESAIKTAKYYRSIGYNARVIPEDKYAEAIEENSRKRQEQIDLQNNVRKYA